MALIQFGGGITRMSGSIAGNTFAKNRYGSYVRARMKPVNPKSGRQVAARTIIQTLTERWHETLNSTQRGAWATYANAVLMKNKLGDNIKLSGFNHYIRSNAARMLADLALVDDGPTTLSLPSVDTGFRLERLTGEQTVRVYFDGNDDWPSENGAAILCHMGRPQLATRNFFAGPWRFADSVNGDSETPPSSPTNIAPPFTLTETQRYWAFHRITRADGRLSQASPWGPYNVPA